MMFFVNSVLLGIGLSMDAFSVSLANGIAEPYMKARKRFLIAGTFAFFQALMPMLGWLCVHTVVGIFEPLAAVVPYAALALLCFIGVKMIISGVRHKEGENTPGVGAGTLLVQGVATSIDALSVGFTIAELRVLDALFSAIIIAAVTFALCTLGVMIGRGAGIKLSNHATVLGGVILVIIGVEIFLKGIL